MKKLVGVLLILALLVSTLIPTMVYAVAPANAYWVGGTGNITDATNHWALVSGGAPGAANLPDETSNVFFDVNSFSGAGQVVTVDATFHCLSMDWTGVTNTPDLAGVEALNVWQNLTFITGMTKSFTGPLRLRAGTGAQTAILAGAQNGPVVLDADTATWTLGDALTCTTFTLLKGALVTANKTVTIAGLSGNTANTKELTLGSSIVNVGASGWNLAATGTTLNADTSTINVSGSVFNGGGGLTYNTVNFTGAAHTINQSDHFNTLALPSGTTQTVTFTDGTTQTVDVLTLSGSAGHVHTLQGSAAAGWGLAVGAGTVTADYISISHSNVGGGATFNAVGTSVNGGNNAGWNFPLTVTTQAASAISMNKDGVTSGTFNGTLTDMGGANDTVWFEYGLTAAYGSTTAPVAKTVPAAFTAAIPAGLTPGATYHYRAKMDNGTTTAVGADQTFTFTMPTVTTGSATNNGTTLNGSVSNMGSASSAYTYFQYGKNTGYGSTTTAGTSSGLGAFLASITPTLNPENTYHYRSVARVGTVYAYGSDVTYTLPMGTSYALLYNLLSLALALLVVVTSFLYIGKNTSFEKFAQSIIYGIVTYVIVQAILRAIA